MSQPPTLDEQIRELRREAIMRDHVYPKMIVRGQLKPDAAERYNRNLAAAIRTLEWLQKNEATVRRAIAEKAELRRAMAEDPIVQDVLDTFPGAEVVD
jgi:hypothetical protein